MNNERQENVVPFKMFLETFLCCCDKLQPLYDMDYRSLTAVQLLRACAGLPDSEAWVEFVRRFQPFIANTILRTAAQSGHNSSIIVDDLVQETFLKICRDNSRCLREFSPNGDAAVFGFIKKIALNVTIDALRSSSTISRGSGNVMQLSNEETTADGTAKPPEEAIEDAILLRQIDSRLSELMSGKERSRDRLVFWLYYRYGYTARTIASIPAIGLTTKGVETVILRLTRLIRQDLSSRGAARKTGADSLSAT